MNWLQKLAKYTNSHSTICEKCLGYLVPTHIAINPKHHFTIGQMFECPCRKAKIWTNSIRNEKEFMRFLDGKPDFMGRVEYTQGFCCDKFCGDNFKALTVTKNGIRVPGIRQNLDRLGVRDLNPPEIPYIAVNFDKEDLRTPESITEWYKEHRNELETIIGMTMPGVKA